MRSTVTSRASSASTSARCPAARSSCAARDGAELGSAVCDYPHARDRAHAARDRRAARRRRGRCRTRTTTARCCASRCPRRVRAAGVRRRRRSSGSPPTSPPRRRCRSCATARRCARSTGFRERPHAYPKLWKHHAAQAQAERVTRVAAERGEPWLARYGGRISSEWEFAKALQVLDEAPEVYDAIDRWIEAADWIVWELCGRETRNVCTAGYKGIHQDGAYPSRGLPGARSTSASPASSPTSSSTRSAPLGARAGGLTARAAAWTGLPEGIAVADRQRRRARDRAGRAGDRARPDGGDHGHLDLPRDEPRRGSPRCPGMCGVVRRRDHAGRVGLRGRAERRRRHLRLGRRPARAAALPPRGARDAASTCTSICPRWPARRPSASTGWSRSTGTAATARCSSTTSSAACSSA